MNPMETGGFLISSREGSQPCIRVQRSKKCQRHWSSRAACITPLTILFVFRMRSILTAYTIRNNHRRIPRKIRP